MSTPSPYLRDRLLQAADGLRKDAETARLNLSEAEQDVAAARALLEEAEAHRDRAKAAVDGIAHDIAWCEAQAAHREPAYDPDAALAATGLMPAPDDGPVSATLYQDNGLPMIWDPSVPPGGYVCAMPHGPNSFGVVLPDGTRVCGMPVESEPCDLHGQPDDFAGNGKPVNGDNVTDLDDLPFNVVQAPADVIAAITGGTRVITDEPPRTDAVHTSGTGAGQLVATHGPTVTMPDTGLNPDPLPPAPPTAEPRHAKPADRPGLLARLTGGHRIVHDEQDGDA